MLIIVFMCLFSFISVLRIFRRKVTKILGTIGWFIRSLCEQALRSRLTLRKEGQVELLGEAPNGLSASASCRKFQHSVN